MLSRIITLTMGLFLSVSSLQIARGQGVLVSKTDGTTIRISEDMFKEFRMVGQSEGADSGYVIHTIKEEIFIPYTEFKRMTVYNNETIELFAYAEGDEKDDETHFYGWKKGKCAIQRAIEATDGKTKTIIHCKGHLKVNEVSMFFRAQNGLNAVVFVPSDKGNIHLIGDGPDNSSIDVSLPDDLTDYYNYEPLEVWGDDCVVKDMSITAKNCRYCIHNDASARTVSNNYTISFVNLRLKHYENAGRAFNSCLGLGISSGMTLITEGCRFIHEDTYTPSLYIHDNKNFELAFTWKIKDCVMEHKHGGLVPLLIQSLGSNVEGVIEWENNDIGTDCPVIYCDQNSNNSVTRIVGHADYPIGYKTRATDTGLALRITSKTTGENSCVRFDKASSAFETLIKGFCKKELKDSTGVVHVDGYLYRDGADVLNGYAMGELSLDKIVGCSMQTRLGDCSLDKKELNVSVDGIEYTIIFDKDYTNYSDEDMIAVFSSVIGNVAYTELYNRGADYFPEIQPSMNHWKNSSEEAILCGMGVYYSNGTIVKAVTDDQVCGVAIEDIAPGCYGRVVTKAVLSIYKDEPHHVCLANYPKTEDQFWNYRHYFGIGETPGIFVNKENTEAPLYGALKGGWNKYLTINIKEKD